MKSLSSSSTRFLYTCLTFKGCEYSIETIRATHELRFNHLFKCCIGSEPESTQKTKTKAKYITGVLRHSKF